ncbi:hypothetical protein MKW98_008149 [Papaver atlanticum]|uniref:Uncharacterized protein n=1 Tax=Papaver atlanticum TaxID=357466 RepID=A0AAD4X9Q2_9MAGN|nr:hypothetical protein MKW98_008149 [Papaver atlanticum]
MAQTRSLTIACLLICTLVSTNTIMCTAAIRQKVRIVASASLLGIGPLEGQVCACCMVV